MSRTSKYYKPITAKPGNVNWPAAVQRAARLLREDPEESLVHTCQNVSLKYLAQLRAEAEEFNSVAVAYRIHVCYNKHIATRKQPC